MQSSTKEATKMNFYGYFQETLQIGKITDQIYLVCDCGCLI